MPGTSTVTSFWGRIGRQFDLASHDSAGGGGRVLAGRGRPTGASLAIGVGILAWGQEIRAHGGPVTAWGRSLLDPVAGTWGIKVRGEIGRVLMAIFCEAAILGIESRCWQGHERSGTMASESRAVRPVPANE